MTIALLASTSAEAEVQSVFPGETWENADPARMGWSTIKLNVAKDHAEKIGSSAVMVVQDGRVIASWGDTQKKMQIHSVRKSFMSALYGIAVAKQQIDLDKTLSELGIDDKPPVLTATEKKATVRDLLRARSGVYHVAAYESESMEERRPERGSHAPGTFWYYNNWDFNMLGVLLRRATGEDTFAAVEKYLARPLQMQDFAPADGRYVYRDESEHPAYPMQFTARDLARFGWLYLNGGRWRGQQVVPADWVAESTRSYSDAKPGIGYGYMWWVSKKDIQFRTHVGAGAFSARGHGGQYIVVAPNPRIVVVHLYNGTMHRELEVGEFGNLLQRIFDAAPKPG
jgi:CubicO group peptidase (beta-lactamase class C family)